MKKILSVIIAITLILSSSILSFSISVQASDYRYSEVEDNNNTYSANRIYDDYTVTGNLTAYDLDYFEFYVATKSIVTVIALSDYNSFCIGLYDDYDNVITADVVGQPYNNYYAYDFSYTVDPGTYYILTLDSELHRRNIYSFNLSIEPANHTHRGGIATCEERAVCTVCGEEYGELKGHNFTSTVLEKASFNTDGTLDNYCNVCNKSVRSSIKRIKTVSLSYSSGTYNGKEKNPSIIVKDSSGNTISRRHYTVTKPKSIKKVGKYKITVTFNNGNYTGKKILYFTVKPPTTKITKYTSGKKSLNIKYTKKSSQTSGYQIAYSTSKSFKKPKYKTVSSYKTTSTTIKNLRANTTYYVKIRTYKKVSGKKYYSNWSRANIMYT